MAWCVCLTSMLAPIAGAATFTVADDALPTPLVVIAYGDMRFTDPAETDASNPAARQALVAKIAAERPAAVFINGDVPYHGIDADYQVFHDETAAWRMQHLLVYPALGNHELGACQTAQCLERWWTAFPQLRGLRWYSVALGSRLVALALDSTSSLLPGSEQQHWLEAEIAALDARVRVVLIIIHHPPVADVQTAKLVDHNPRPNEQALAAYLTRIAAHSAVRYVVSAGHIHNYERLERAGVMYLVSGGGGAHPYEIDRTPDDLYRNTDFPNFHYLRLTLGARTLSADMVRLNEGVAGNPVAGNPAAGDPARWQIRDRFELALQP